MTPKKKKKMVYSFYFSSLITCIIYRAEIIHRMPKTAAQKPTQFASLCGNLNRECRYNNFFFPHRLWKITSQLNHIHTSSALVEFGPHRTKCCMPFTHHYQKEICFFRQTFTVSSEKEMYPIYWVVQFAASKFHFHSRFFKFLAPFLLCDQCLLCPRPKLSQFLPAWKPMVLDCLPMDTSHRSDNRPKKEVSF